LNSPALITLTTDLGLKDNYVAAVKGAIFKQLPEARIVDVTHEITKFNAFEAAFILRSVYRDFPEDSVHVIGVLPEETEAHPHLAIRCDGHYFVGTDNGIFSLLFDKRPDQMVRIDLKRDLPINTFPTRDVFVKAACHLARGGTLEVLGQEVESVNAKAMPKPVLEPNQIRGSVLYIDSYGNVISNISRKMFDDIGAGRRFSISFRKPGFDISDLSESYSDVIVAERLALFGSNGLLEIAISYGDASKLMGMEVNDMVSIIFES